MGYNPLTDLVDSVQKGFNLGLDLRERRKIIADRLRLTRIAANLKQKDIAEKTNLNATTYSGYENEVVIPPIEALIRIADYYQISLDYLTGRTDNKYGIIANIEQQPTVDDLEKRIEKLEAIIKTQNHDIM